MAPELPAADRSAIEAILRRLEAAWNAMDPEAFAEPFTEDADFVNIVGEHHRGRPAIVAGHHAIFRDFYADSTTQLTLMAARLLSPDVALAHVHSALDAPRGPLAGHNTAVFSMVLTKERGPWQIAAFHNTRQMARGPRAGAHTGLDS